MFVVVENTVSLTTVEQTTTPDTTQPFVDTTINSVTDTGSSDSSITVTGTTTDITPGIVDSSNTGTIIGVLAALLVTSLLVIIVAVLVLIMARRGRKQYYSVQHNTNNPNSLGMHARCSILFF